MPDSYYDTKILENNPPDASKQCQNSQKHFQIHNSNPAATFITRPFEI